MQISQKISNNNILVLYIKLKPNLPQRMRRFEFLPTRAIAKVDLTYFAVKLIFRTISKQYVY